MHLYLISVAPRPRGGTKPQPVEPVSIASDLSGALQEACLRREAEGYLDQPLKRQQGTPRWVTEDGTTEVRVLPVVEE